MKILVDENIPLISVESLRNLGHDVLDIRGTSLQGITDEKLMNMACHQRRLLITTDRDFAHYRTTSHYGIMIITLSKPNSVRINNRILLALNESGIYAREAAWRIAVEFWLKSKGYIRVYNNQKVSPYLSADLVS
jgi:predicted nuclease of predicted toxin-antitoxin system